MGNQEKKYAKLRIIRLLGGGEALFRMKDTELRLYNLNLGLFEAVIRVFESLNSPLGLSTDDCSQSSYQSMPQCEPFQTEVDT